jgi:CheY-specific phosphatase CheX
MADKFEMVTFDALDRAVGDVLETMFFAEVSGPACPPDASAVGAAMTFRGEPSGYFSLCLTPQAAKRLTVDFMGAEDPDAVTQEDISAVVRELANMICGAVLSCVYKDGVFDLASPEPFHGLAPEPPAGALRRSFDLGDGALRVCLAWD